MNSLSCKINHLFKEKVKFAAVLCSNTLFSSYVTKRWKPWSPNRAQFKLSCRNKTLATWHTCTHVHSKECFLSPWKPEHWSCTCLNRIFSIAIFSFHIFLLSHLQNPMLFCLSRDKEDNQYLHNSLQMKQDHN